MSWQDQANRALTMFEGSTDDHEDHSWQIFNLMLDESNHDDYISHDFFNVKQTAGGLPDGVTFDDFVNLVAGHVRAELDTLDDQLGDDDFRTAALSERADDTSIYSCYRDFLVDA
jgi:hypothetical protein